MGKILFDLVDHGSVGHFSFGPSIGRPVSGQTLEDGRDLGDLAFLGQRTSVVVLLGVRNSGMAQNTIQTELISNGRFLVRRRPCQEFWSIPPQTAGKDVSLRFRQGMQSVLLVGPMGHGKGGVLLVGSSDIDKVTCFFFVMM